MCRESHVHGRLDLRELVEHAFDELANLDTRALRTIGDLTVAPAKVCRDYLDGRRVLYVNPFKYALTGFTFGLLVFEALLWLHGPPADPVAAKVEAFELRWGMVLNFVMMPILAAIMWPLFATARPRLRWVEHYVVVLYSFGHVALLQGLFAPLLQPAGAVGSVLSALMPAAMLSWVAVGVYEGRWWATVAKSLFAFAVIQAIALGVLRLCVPELASAS